MTAKVWDEELGHFKAEFSISLQFLPSSTREKGCDSGRLRSRLYWASSHVHCNQSGMVSG